MSNNIVIETRQIVINTEHADIYNNGSLLSSMYFSFPALLIDEPDIVSTYISLSSASIANSFYIVNENNNKLIINYGTGDQTILFNVGNYQANNFITEFISKLPSGFNMTFNRLTGKYTITYTTNFTILSSSTCFQLLGFTNSQNYTSISNSLLMPYPADFSGIRSIKIKSQVLRTLNRDSFTSNYSGDICIIPVNQPIYNIIQYNNISNVKNLLQNKTLDYIDIEVTDEKNQLINFNNIHYSFVLQIDIYKKILMPDMSTQILRKSLRELTSIFKQRQPEQQQIEQQQEQQAEPEQQQETTIETEEMPFSDDNDLDLLMYQMGIYQ